MIFVLDRPDYAPLGYTSFSLIENSNLMIKNVHFNIFARDDSPAAAIAIFSETRWDPTDTEPRYYNFSDVSLTVYPSNNYDRDRIFSTFYIV